ncbi:hypothetical protein LCGC14_3113950 [marine sediment metagenome]|uniref:Uncharacterized protein n=1 Tax=marine sediment metagenome TaxID=412755 RepID=A0A0F8W4N8_9ZZZZ
MSEPSEYKIAQAKTCMDLMGLDFDEKDGDVFKDLLRMSAESLKKIETALDKTKVKPLSEF